MRPAGYEPSHKGEPPSLTLSRNQQRYPTTSYLTYNPQHTPNILLFCFGGDFVKASRYCHFQPLDEGRVAAYNARTGSYLIITEKCRKALEAPQFVPENVSLAERMILSEFGFLLDDLMRLPRRSPGASGTPVSKKL